MLAYARHTLSLVPCHAGPRPPQFVTTLEPFHTENVFDSEDARFVPTFVDWFSYGLGVPTVTQSPNTDGRGSVDAEQAGDLNSPFGTIEDPSPVILGSCLQHQFNPRSGDMESPLLRR